VVYETVRQREEIKTSTVLSMSLASIDPEQSILSVTQGQYPIGVRSDGYTV